MSDMNFEQLLADYLPGDYKPGAVIEATITRKELEYSFLDISSKLEGRVRSFEIKDLNVGDKVSVQVIRTEEDFVIVSKLALDRLRELESYNVSDVVSGTVVKQIKGGYNVKIKNINAFLPLSLSGAKGNEIVGKTFDFLIKEKNKKGITLSKTDLTRKEISDFIETLELGAVVSATVKEILDFGAVLELGPTTGLLHISELSWEQTNDINSVLKIGDVINVKIIELNKEKAKIKFSIKQLTENPWLATKQKYTIGEKRTGVVKEILDFGLIINIDGTNDEGFMHISDINYRKFFKLDKNFKVGDKVTFVITNLNDEKQRISLSSKAILDELWENIDNIIAVGDIIKGKVLFTQDYGMFVELDNKLEAFIRRNEYAWTKSELTEFNENDEIEFRVIAIDKENKKITGSIKEMYISPWVEAMDQFRMGQVVTVPITDKIESGLLVQLTNRFKGLIPAREIVSEHNVGDEITAAIIDSNEKKSSIILSEKKVVNNKQKAEMDELMKKYGAE
ncbi:S1 RNA-binding domain-containing protein [Sneathia sanguinegens]|uniref:S1 RNA-binding domain-containing protein n=1 Tax=Sneathia sanguinegens TaxID=40543 RepID=UPI00288B85D9|nr:S1 RNA-binding domain-containing protein [Sneathia sanguinegens]